MHVKGALLAFRYRRIIIPLVILSIFISGVFVLLPAAFMMMGGSGSKANAATCAPTNINPADIHGVTGLSPEQLTNAGIIISVGKGMGVPDQGIVISLMTALQESTLINLPYGDRDSLGLFQQRPSAGWGTPAQIMDPVYSSTKFFTALLAVPNWQAMPLTLAAQAVQRSAFPDAYARWEGLARAIAAGAGIVNVNGTPCAANIGAGGSELAQAAVKFAVDQVGKPYVWGAAGPDSYDCSGLTMAAYATVGISLPHFTGDQVKLGVAVSQNELLPGDLVFPDPGHVQMYVGNGYIVEAPDRGLNVRVVPMWGFEQARRLV